MDALHVGWHYIRIAQDSFHTDGTTRTMELWLWLEDDTKQLVLSLLCQVACLRFVYCLLFIGSARYMSLNRPGVLSVAIVDCWIALHRAQTRSGFTYAP
jgi:hypothetical protein